MNIYHLDCCPRRDHTFIYDDGAGERWVCRACNEWWTMDEYASAAEHDDELEQAERAWFEYGREELWAAMSVN